jgi:hypothetical protein
VDDEKKEKNVGTVGEGDGDSVTGEVKSKGTVGMTMCRQNSATGEVMYKNDSKGEENGKMGVGVGVGVGSLANRTGPYTSRANGVCC